jgi:ectoine hydroxylase-related dioxygenase (phytanoyl-CoA dioxygenase family)
MTEALLPAVLDTPFPALAPDAVDRFARDGHVVVPGLLAGDDLVTARESIRDVVIPIQQRARDLSERDTYGKAFIQVENLWRRSQEVAAFTFARRFGSVAAALLGVPAVRVYHDQALFKEAGGGRTPWHQDQGYWPLDTDRTITMWMPLVPVTEQMGGLRFVSGSHLLGEVDDVVISDKSDEVFETFLDHHDLAVSENGPMAAGDASFHAGWTIHAAAPNGSSTGREVMTVIYFADGTRVREPSNRYQESDLANFVPGGVPGELAASHLNPVAFSAGR